MHRFNWFDICLSIYSATGLLGTFWIVDEFDAMRLTLVSFVGIPSIVLWLFLRSNYPTTLQRFRLSAIALAAGVVGVFGWGNVLGLNALGDGQEPVQMAQQIGSITGNVAHLRGPLGIIYRPRF